MAYDGFDLPFLRFFGTFTIKICKKLPSPYMYISLCETTEEGFHDTLHYHIQNLLKSDKNNMMLNVYLCAFFAPLKHELSTECPCGHSKSPRYVYLIIDHTQVACCD